MTTAIETAASKEESERRLKTNTGDQPLTLLEKVDLRAVAVDIPSGKITRDILLLSVKEPQWVHALNSYASPTPVVANGRLYCHFGALGTACADTLSGQLLWKNTDLVVMHENGPGSSPILWEGKLIFHMDGSDKQFVAALDAETGKLAWKTDRSGSMHSNPQLRKSYGTPLVVSVAGQPQLLSPGSNWLYAYDTAGKELWKLSYGTLGFSLTPRPVTAGGIFYMSTGFSRPEILAIKCNQGADAEILWRFAKGVPTMPSPILAGKELYFVSDGGVLTCLDARTGEQHYRERLGGEFSASPTLAADRLHFSNREGLTFVVKAGPAFAIQARNQVQGKIFASLAAKDNAFFLRTDSALYKIAAAGK
jgi:outer membrane protein assembly factor BamB